MTYIKKNDHMGLPVSGSAIEEVSYHIYGKDKVLYCNLTETEFEEKWEMLNVMVDILDTDYNQEDLSYIRLENKVGMGGPGRVLYNEPAGGDSY